MKQDKALVAYLAGIFDGEGCAHIASVNMSKYTGYPVTGYRVDVHITNTSLDLVKWLVRNFGGVYYHVPMNNKNWKEAYRWVPKGKKNKEEMFLAILPYLVVKREIVKLCLEFLRIQGINPDERKRLCTLARELTRRGKSVETNMSGSEEIPMKIEPELIGDYESDPVVILDS